MWRATFGFSHSLTIYHTGLVIVRILQANILFYDRIQMEIKSARNSYYLYWHHLTCQGCNLNYYYSFSTTGSGWINSIQTYILITSFSNQHSNALLSCCSLPEATFIKYFLPNLFCSFLCYFLHGCTFIERFLLQMFYWFRSL
jgi:hypothetical protein